MNNVDKELTFVLLHGSWHDRRCWSRLIGELGARGHRSLAIDLDSTANLDQQAETVANVLKTQKQKALEEGVILVGHSRAANLAPRIPRHLGYGAVRSIVLLAGSLLPETVGKSDLPERNYRQFVDAISTDENNMSTIDPGSAPELLYNMCEPDIAVQAIKRLRPYRRNGPEAPLKKWPDVQTYYLRPGADNIIKQEWVDAVAPELPAEIVNIPGDHSPMLSRPSELARTLIRLAAKDEAETINHPLHLLPTQPTSREPAPFAAL